MAMNICMNKYDFLIVLNQTKTHIKNYIVLISIHTVQPVLRGHLWDKEKVVFKTGDLLKEVQFM